MNTEENRRESHRVHLSSEISGAVDGLVLADIKNLSAGGLCLVSRIQIGEGKDFIILFPAIGKIEEREVDAKVMRCDKIEPEKYEIGARFLDADPKYLKEILALLHAESSKTE